MLPFFRFFHFFVLFATDGFGTDRRQLELSERSWQCPVSPRRCRRQRGDLFEGLVCVPQARTARKRLVTRSKGKDSAHCVESRALSRLSSAICIVIDCNRGAFLRVRHLLNAFVSAQSRLRLCNCQGAIEDCDRALTCTRRAFHFDVLRAVNPENAKALYRRGLAFAKTGKLVGTHTCCGFGQHAVAQRH